LKIKEVTLLFVVIALKTFTVLTLLWFGRAKPPTGQHLLSRRGLANDDPVDVSTCSPKPFRDEYIFDRWGSLAFSREHTMTNAPDAGWNGKVQGKAAALGIYAWQATLEYENGHRHQIKGEVMLVQ
jgi:hypothetical protein